MIIELNQEIIQKLTKTEFEIVKFINNNEKKLNELSIVDIAFETFSSPATVSRAIRKCGMNGFHELRYKLTNKNEDNDIYSLGEIINKSLIEARNSIEQISMSNVLKIIDKIKSSSKIYILSRGLTEYVADEFSLKLQLLNCNVFSIKDPNIMKIRTKNMKKDEMVFIFSLNGETSELVESAKNANSDGVCVVTCCCNSSSSLLQYSELSLIGHKHSHSSIKEFEVSSRLPIYIISRIIVDYMVSQSENQKIKDNK
ncbi:MurR/RpiR family transcriptional regulator [Intestinibacter sp.]